MGNGGKTLEEATHTLSFGKIGKMSGSFGLITVDKNGNFFLIFNTSPKIVGFSDESGYIKIGILKIFIK